MKIKKIVQFAATSIFFLSSLACTQRSSLGVSDLKCEYLIDPLGINTQYPRFNWVNLSEIRGAHQTAFQIVVATDIDKLSENKADCWNSGKIHSSESILVKYDGVELSPGQLLYWKVKVWDENDKVSKWSNPAKFSIGLVDKDSWAASYIGYTENENEDEANKIADGFQACPQFRKQFTVDNKSVKETYLLHVNSLGYHEVYLNGVKVGENVLSPAVSQLDKRSLINTYDVTDYIHSGTNNLIFWIGSGWYTEGLPGVTEKGPMVKAQLEKVSGAKVEKVLVTDDRWTARNSEYRRISNWRSGRYGGEEVTGNEKAQNVALTNPDEVTWYHVFIADVPGHEVTPQMVEPNKIKKTVVPHTISRLNDRTFLVDMGTTITGWFEIKFPILMENQKIEMEYSDHLNEDGEIVPQGQTDRYIASGSGTEFFCNKFNYHGFRYIKISNLEKKPEIKNIKAHFIHTDYETASTFVSSDEDLNGIHDMIAYTLRNVSLGGYLVDCPHIERLGYGGDGNASLIAAQTMFNMAPLYANWLQAWGDVIREDGGLPHTAPSPYRAGGGPFWCGFVILASWKTYQHYGDIRILEKYYPVMQKWLEYVERYRVDGLLKQWPNTDYRNWYLGDWATPESVGNPDHLDERSVDLVNNCFVSSCFGMMSEIASVLGIEEDKERYSEMRIDLNRKIHDTFYCNELGYYSTGSQIDLIFPLLAGVTPKELRKKLVTTLIQKTKNEYDGHLNTGLVGIPVMMEWAATANEPDFIYSMLKQKSYPGYLYMIEKGATTTWEHWNGHRSRMHNCYNGVGQWFYQVIGGIRPIKGEIAYKKFIIQPQIPKGVVWAKTSKETPYGKIVVDWELENEKIKIFVEVPVGSTGFLEYPAGTTEIIMNNEEVSTDAEKIELESGKHMIEYIMD